MSSEQTAPAPPRLRTARVLRVEEERCEIWDGGEIASVGFAPIFPTPRVERVSPGHVVALATRPDGKEVVVWRWYDAVVLGTSTGTDAEGDGSILLWEPAHGEVVAQSRSTYDAVEPGMRAYASAGLPGADWWVACDVDGDTVPEVELDAVQALFTDNDLWAAVLA